MESNHRQVAYETTALPLSYRDIILVRTKGIKPLTPGWKPGTLSLRQARFIMVPPRGLEPRAWWLQINCSTNWAIRALNLLEEHTRYKTVLAHCRSLLAKVTDPPIRLTVECVHLISLWSGRQDSNLQLRAPKARALPLELLPVIVYYIYKFSINVHNYFWMPCQGSNLNSSESKSDVLPITPQGIGGSVRYRSSPANGSDLQSDCRSHRLYRPIFYTPYRLTPF